MKLYEIEQAILNCYDTETGEIIDIDALEMLQIERSTKIDNIISLYKNLSYEVEAIKHEEQTLATRRKQKEANIERIKKWLAMATNGQKFETARNKIAWRQSESVDLVDVFEIPDEFKEEVLTVKFDKAAIKEAIKKGLNVAGARLEVKKNIQIK